MTNCQLTGPEKSRLVLLLHGWGDSHEGLQILAEKLSRHYRVARLDLPGFGGTQPPQKVWDLDDYAGFVRAFLIKTGIGQPYAIIGHSNGGALAIRGLGQSILTAQKLILMASSGVRTGNELKRFLLKVIAKTGNVATIWMPERYRRALRKSLYGAVGSDALVAPHLTETFKRTVRQDVQADAGKLELPTLLIFADNDDAVPLDDGRRYHQLIKNSRLEIIKDAGHFLHQQKPAEVMALIEDFLK